MRYEPELRHRPASESIVFPSNALSLQNRLDAFFCWHSDAALVAMTHCRIPREPNESHLCKGCRGFGAADGELMGKDVKKSRGGQIRTADFLLPKQAR